MEIGCDHNTVHADLIDLAETVVGIITPRASEMAVATGLPACRVTLRITDSFVAEVLANDPSRYADYSTERVGGSVMAITLPSSTKGEDILVLVDSSMPAGDPLIRRLYFPSVVAHEVGHCLVNVARSKNGEPKGHSSQPKNLIETVNYTALSVCDEYTADALAKLLFPPLTITITAEGDSVQVNDRKVLAEARVSKMLDDLDKIYPGWRDSVESYRTGQMDLDQMTCKLVTSIQEGLIASAHYRTAIDSYRGDSSHIATIGAHRGSQLYLALFWDCVGPHLESHPPTQHLANVGQEAYDSAVEAVTAVWGALGITFDLLPNGQVYVHVDEPLS